MESLTIGAGLGALGFWLFIAAVIAAGVWDSIRKRDAQHETLRRIVESGQQIDDALADKVLQLTTDTKELGENMWLAGVILLVVSVALTVFGWALGLALKPVLFPILASVGGLVAIMGLGFLIIARMLARRAEQQGAR